MSALGGEADMLRPPAPYQSDATDPNRSSTAFNIRISDFGTSAGFYPSLRLDVGCADHLRPLGGIRLDEDSKLLRRIEGRLKTELRDPLAHVGLHGDLHDVRMHLADDSGRRAGWR